jgi:NAD(P)-dependent dehydrogenase (short-subunit alcohol dehydrogenase family)
VIHVLRAFVPILMQQSQGYVVNTASIAGLVAGPFMAPYNASKHAVVALSETLHHEMAMMAPHVKVSVLCPGWVRTRIADSARNRPDEPEAESAGIGARAAPHLGRQRHVVRRGRGQGARRDSAEQFWILPHRAGQLLDRVRERTDAVLSIARTRSCVRPLPAEEPAVE